MRLILERNSQVLDNHQIRKNKHAHQQAMSIDTNERGRRERSQCTLNFF